MENTAKNIETLLLNRNVDIHDCILHTDYENLDIIQSCLTLSEAEERIKGDVISPQQFKLKRHLKKVEDEYDYCIIDTSPSLSIININGLVAADEIYIPLKCDGGSLLGVAIIMSIVDVVRESNPELKVGEYIIPITIATNKNIEEGSLMQIPLLAYDNGKNKCKATKDYIELTEYILNKN